MPPPTKSKKRKADDDHEDVYKVASTRGFKLKGSGGKKMKEMLGKVEEGDSGDAKRGRRGRKAGVEEERSRQSISIYRVGVHSPVKQSWLMAGAGSRRSSQT